MTETFEEFEVLFEIGEGPKDSNIWRVTLNNFSVKIENVDGIWEITSYETEQIEYHGRFKSLETAIGEAVLLVSG